MSDSDVWWKWVSIIWVFIILDWSWSLLPMLELPFVFCDRFTTSFPFAVYNEFSVFYYTSGSRSPYFHLFFWASNQLSFESFSRWRDKQDFDEESWHLLHRLRKLLAPTQENILRSLNDWAYILMPLRRRMQLWRKLGFTQQTVFLV